MPDGRTRQGKRDLALLHLLGSAGLRRGEAANLLITDVDERKRASDPRLRAAIARSTSWWVTIRYGKRGRTRAIPLDEDALAAITAWVKGRPAAATEHLLLSLPRTGQPPRPLGTRDIARIVARHAQAAGVPEDRRAPHVLRHTFCTHLADSGADTAVIRELAGHADIRTTTIYTNVNPARLEQAGDPRDRGARIDGIRGPWFAGLPCAPRGTGCSRQQASSRFRCSAGRARGLLGEVGDGLGADVDGRSDRPQSWGGSPVAVPYREGLAR